MAVDKPFYRGTKPRRRTRKPKTLDARRTCRYVECTTVLSRYNGEPYCWSHAPRKIPRLRGAPKDTVRREMSCVGCSDLLLSIDGETFEIWIETTLHWRLSARGRKTLCGVATVSGREDASSLTANSEKGDV